MRAFARAKVNLALHVTGRRNDGYHLLDSLVVFADIGDWLEIAPAETFSLTITGPRASGVPDDARNLVWQAADLIGPGRGARITLDKHLPHAGGIGGGSADAAAALRALAQMWDVPLPSGDALLALGADMPVCLHARPCRMGGVGEILDEVPPLPPLWLVLVNAGVAVPTGPVFKALATVDNRPLYPMTWSDVPSFTHWLCGARNDLEAPARALAPEIAMVLDHLNAQPGCAVARMSGSGGTCFGLFTAEDAAKDATLALRAAHPDWWVQDGAILS